ncbi:MAG TPA: hypothetical protein VKP02_01715, partial [Gemmatimonadaceae bacterium]|nr:hypothetical protein [Gemmatimonadaceae bacterium]
MNALPTPGVLVKVMSPPSARANRRLIARPIPDPAAAPGSNRANSRNTIACFSNAIPGPLSVTVMAAQRP